MLRAENGSLTLSSGVMDYIRFGSGPRKLVMIPGVGDGLKTVKGMALPFVFLYRETIFLCNRAKGILLPWQLKNACCHQAINQATSGAVAIVTS